MQEQGALRRKRKSHAVQSKIGISYCRKQFGFNLPLDYQNMNESFHKSKTGQLFNTIFYFIFEFVGESMIVLKRV